MALQKEEISEADGVLSPMSAIGARLGNYGEDPWHHQQTVRSKAVVTHRT